MNRGRVGTIAAAAALATAIAGVIAYGSIRESEPVATGEELRSAAQRVLAATGGLWATIGPRHGGGTWEAAVVRPDLSTATVILNERFQVISVTSSDRSPSGARDAQSYAAAFEAGTGIGH
jgi:hypothetical protein